LSVGFFYYCHLPWYLYIVDIDVVSCTFY
jgi:hypothetical protein